MLSYLLPVLSLLAALQAAAANPIAAEAQPGLEKRQTLLWGMCTILGQCKIRNLHYDCTNVPLNSCQEEGDYCHGLLEGLVIRHVDCRPNVPNPPPTLA